METRFFFRKIWLATAGSTHCCATPAPPQAGRGESRGAAGPLGRLGTTPGFETAGDQATAEGAMGERLGSHGTGWGVAVGVT